MGKLSKFFERKIVQLKAGSEAMVASLDSIICSQNNKEPVFHPDVPHRIRHPHQPSCPSASDLSSADADFDPRPYELRAEDGRLVLKRSSAYSRIYHQHANEQLAAPNPLGIVLLGEGADPEVAELEGDTSHNQREGQWYINLQGQPLVARPNLVDNLSQPSISEPPQSNESLVLDPDNYAWPPDMQGPGSPYRQVPRPASGTVARLKSSVPPKGQAGVVIKRKPVPKPPLRKSYLEKKPLPEPPFDQERQSHPRSFREHIEDFVGRPMPSLSASADRISFRASAGKDILCIFAEIDPVAPGFTNKVVAKVLRGRSRQSTEFANSNPAQRNTDGGKPAEQLRELREVVERKRMFVHISEPLLHMGEPFKIDF
ncbi:hypothetical protein MMC11_000819 [Xylographa trunciseda]|nr:hypothetical protein [Xylographa trunciseda]